MAYSNRSRTYDYFDSLQPEEAATAAELVIKNLKENPTPWMTELWRNFLRDFHKRLKEESTSTSSKFSSDENPRWIGEKLVVLSKEIGKENDGTVTYEGYYEDRPVTVKRLPRSHHIVVDREIKHLIKSDQYHNIARYHGMESDRDFYYLAVEHCDCNLDDLIQMYSLGSFGQFELVYNDFHSETVYEEDRLEKLQRNLGNVKLWEGHKARPSPLLLKLMRDVVSGLVYLHALNIIHRDLKPKSILIVNEISTLCAKLSDMGISRSCAATGWKAPEQLLCGQQTRATDMFSFGCILFFCITQGKHPFGEPDERDRNIKSNNKKNLFLIRDFPEAFHLISRLLGADDPKKRTCHRAKGIGEEWRRPNANEVLQHPLFWNAKKRLSFLRDTSDRAEDINSELSEALNGTADTVLDQYSKVKNWYKKVGDKIMRHMLKYRSYNYSSVQDLLRVIRNMFNHYEELPTHIQKLVGSLNEGLDDFFTSKFPMLLIEVHEVVGKECWRSFLKDGIMNSCFLVCDDFWSCHALHMGLVDQGRIIFASMARDYSIVPKLSTMVKWLIFGAGQGRLKRLRKKFPRTLHWPRKQLDTLRYWICLMMVGSRVVLANIYAEAEWSEDVDSVRKLRDRGVKNAGVGGAQS
ncbi:hypothetical protein TIFTF001_028204 [Ficus carica]|uniref:non-specific serine/threonine protein kinase n=1 Tax=Ficus carica TaxID=3494 RepID=A0AA88DPH2_FICCA|nr:hypothetical protein TIFTF001_028204 [Ficus carica]